MTQFLDRPSKWSREIGLWLPGRCVIRVVKFSDVGLSSFLAYALCGPEALSMRDLLTEANVLAQERLLRGRFYMILPYWIDVNAIFSTNTVTKICQTSWELHFIIRIRSALYNDEDESDSYDCPLRYHIKKTWTYFCVQPAKSCFSFTVVEFLQDLGFNDTQGFGLLVVLSVPWQTCFSWMWIDMMIDVNLSGPCTQKPMSFSHQTPRFVGVPR